MKMTIYNTTNPFLENISLWKRYIDDVLMIWTGEEAKLKAFFEWIKEQSPDL